MTVLKICKIGDVNGVELPDEILAAANAGPGDDVTITVTAAGIIQIVPSGRAISEQVEKARDLASRYAGALATLAK